MRVAAFMSGAGSNILRLLEHEQSLKEKEGSSPFEVVFIFSDRSDGSCKGERIALERGIFYVSHDVRAFHRIRGLKRAVGTPQGLSARKEFDRVAANLVEAFDIDVIALGGYMSYLTLDRCVNVHPADLSLLTHEGKRKYVGDNAVLDAISAGERVLRSSTIWTDQGVDTGPLLMVSQPVMVELQGPIESLVCRSREAVPSGRRPPAPPQRDRRLEDLSSNHRIDCPGALRPRRRESRFPGRAACCGRLQRIMLTIPVALV